METIKKAYKLNFHPKVTRDQIVLALDEILKLNGCTGCGLNGRDFTFGVRPVDDFLFDARRMFTDVQRFKSPIEFTEINVQKLDELAF
jgi:hypothetical protein